MTTIYRRFLKRSDPQRRRKDSIRHTDSGKNNFKRGIHEQMKAKKDQNVFRFII